ncbi:MAG: diadenylate cyclase CdaA [Eubacterium sp.]|nr:diadenylate cyclase CdaA [Eubacterium sp.]
MPFSLFEITFQFQYLKNLWSSITNYAKQVQGLFNKLDLIDIVDILFVAVVIYTIIRIIRETRAMQLLKGIVFLIALYMIVTFLGMSASSYIFKEIFSYILIIIVVLFGPEIRNVLEQMGKGAATSGLRNVLISNVSIDMKKTIDSVCKACTNMSDDKIGALIVFEKDTRLGEVISSGTVLNAEPTHELIENIFFPKSPLHDGAMIIRSSQIYAAGCILPLTREYVSSSLGTRHRAAIGVTQESDAIVVVVSEETGSISIAQNGTLKRDVSSGELRDTLEQQFILEDNKSGDKFLKKMLRGIKK